MCSFHTTGGWPDQRWSFSFFFLQNMLKACCPICQLLAPIISRVSDQDGIFLLYNMLEIHHSGNMETSNVISYCST